MSDESGVVIERLVVEEGFLDGIDVTFEPGLNVIIGHRGVGKTSMIQLLRFCLGGRWAADRDQEAGLSLARSALGGDGRVSVSMRLGRDHFVASRRATDAKAEGQNPFVRPIVFAQGEIESVALDPRGRLRLIDDFIPGQTLDRAVDDLFAQAASLTRELAETREAIGGYDERLTQLDGLRSALNDAQHRAATTGSSDLNQELQRLEQISSQTAALRSRIDAVKSDGARLSRWAVDLTTLRQSMPVDKLDDGFLNSAGVRPLLASTMNNLDRATDSIAAALDLAREELSGLQVAEKELSDEARVLRTTVEATQEGMGSALREVATLQEQIADLETLARRAEGHRERVSDLTRRRDAVLELIDSSRAQRFAARAAVASDLERSLAPQIEVRVERSGLHDEYASLIANSLRGSGVRYGQLSADIADLIAPAELVALVENMKVPELSQRLNIPPDRAVRITEALRREGLQDIVRAPIDDAVTLRLLDGGDHKPTTELSTGQRCTVVLPILMLHDDRPLLIDQPEDNLDGAFIADTLVRAIRQRREGSQLIVTTHNANIPVLGEAAKVIHLGSDGKRGHVIHASGLDDEETVDAITSVMEGGREAFRRRAAFYKQDAW